MARRKVVFDESMKGLACTCMRLSRSAAKLEETELTIVLFGLHTTVSSASICKPALSYSLDVIVGDIHEADNLLR